MDINYTGHYALEVGDDAWIVVELTQSGNGVTPVPRASVVYRTENEALQAGLDRAAQDAEIAERQRKYAEAARRSR